MTEYVKKDSEIRKSIQELLSLPYLLPEFIEIEFNIIRRQAPRLNVLDTLFVYIEQNWIKSQLWPHKNWTVFNKKIRTNNDCEGLHHLWNMNFCQNSLAFYCLLGKLHQVCIGVPLQVTLIANDKLKRKEKAADVKRNKDLKEVWDQLIAKTIDANTAHHLITGILRPELCYHDSRVDQEFNDGLVRYSDDEDH